jgi:hypothetical protein
MPADSLTDPAPVTDPASPRASSRRWRWFFLLLAVLAILAMGINYTYNQGQQLQRPQLEAARQRWQANPPRDYDLRVIRRYQGAGSDRPTQSDIRLTIRDGKIVNGTLDDQPLEARLHAEYDVPGLFDAIDDFLSRDRRSGQPPTFLRAVFDKKDGHLLEFVRRVSGTRERQQIVVELKRPPSR